MKINLQTNKTEQSRIDALLEDIIDNPRNNAIVMLEEVELKYFYGNDNKAKLEYIETNNIELVRTIRKEPSTEYNLCIIEINSDDDKDFMNIANEFKGKKELVGVVINKDLPTKYRINYLHK